MNVSCANSMLTQAIRQAHLDSHANGDARRAFVLPCGFKVTTSTITNNGGNPYPAPGHDCQSPIQAPPRGLPGDNCQSPVVGRPAPTPGHDCQPPLVGRPAPAPIHDCLPPVQEEPCRPAPAPVHDCLPPVQEEPCRPAPAPIHDCLPPVQEEPCRPAPTPGHDCQPPIQEDPCLEPQDKWSVTPVNNGKALIDLGDKYALELNEEKSQIIIINKENGERTNIWGDPHVDWDADGKTDVDFWGKTTFQLEDGTKITIGTIPGPDRGANGAPYFANDITVTRGDQAIQITGLSQTEMGNLEITQSENGGRFLDAIVDDGFVIRENIDGAGWISSDTGEIVEQEEFDNRKPDVYRTFAEPVNA